MNPGASNATPQGEHVDGAERFCDRCPQAPALLFLEVGRLVGHAGRVNARGAALVATAGMASPL